MMHGPRAPTGRFFAKHIHSRLCCLSACVELREDSFLIKWATRDEGHAIVHLRSLFFRIAIVHLRVAPRQLAGSWPWRL
jgi:hypothetical protein